MSSIYGHTIRADVDAEWINTVANARFYISFAGFTTITGTPVRVGYKNFITNNGVNFNNSILVKLPDNKNDWPATDTNRTAADTNYFSIKYYLYSNSGGSIKINSANFYDLGILEENE